MKIRAQRGFTLTELAIVLGIVGGIIGGIWYAASNANIANKAQKSATQIMQIYNGYKSIYTRTGIDTASCFTATNDVTCLGVNAGFFPSEMVLGACTPNTPSTYPQTPWGNGSYATVQTCQSHNTFAITYSALSQASCISLANAIYNSTSAMSYQAMYNGTTWFSQWVTSATPPWTSATIAAQCGANNSNAVQIGLLAQ